MKLARFILALPFARGDLARDLLDSFDLSFEELLAPEPGITSRGGPVLRFFVAPEEEQEWRARLAVHMLDRFLTVDLFDYDPADWVSRWKEYYDWSRISPRLAVGPDFKPCPWPAPLSVAIRPGQAFGTGIHESTRIALTFIDRLFEPGWRMADIGCGTGILAIAAAKMGAKLAVGCDIEREAISEALANGTANQVSLELYRGGIEALSGSFELVAANMLAFRLLGAATLLRRLTAPGGLLVLAGLILRDRDSFLPSFFCGDNSFDQVAEMELGNWWGAAFRRRPGQP